MAERRVTPGLWGLAKNLVAVANQQSVLVNRAVGTSLDRVAGLKIGTTAGQVRSEAFTFRLAGVAYAKAAVAAGTALTATTHDVADGYHRRFVLSIQANGTITITHGTTALHAAAAVAPATPAGEAKLGEVYIKAHGALFDATTTALTPSDNLTVEYTDEAADVVCDTITYIGGGTPT